MLKKFATDLTRGVRSMVRGIDADWHFNERRRALRFKCRHKVDLLQGEKKSVAYVINYGLGGVRLSNPGSIKVGETVQLRFPHPLPGVSVRSVACEVLWRRKNTKTLEILAGLKFVEDGERMANSWLNYFFKERKATPEDLREKREFVRVPCKLELVARSDSDRGVGEVHNVSLGGAYLLVNRPAEVGDTWLLDIGGLSSLKPFHFQSTVLSCEMGESGLYAQRVKFKNHDEINLALLRKYLLALSKDFWTD